MKINNIQKIMSFLMITAFFVFSGCSSDSAEPADTADNTADSTQEISLTLDELKEYNGENGLPAYVAYDGVIYDVSDEPQWTSGSHGGNMAGTDITENLNNAPHGTTKLNGLDVVGKLVE
ncbi:MAG: cytochrome b5 domain-containing protein [Eubacteriales bacterium]